MRILLFAPQIPFPPHQGTTIRNFNIIRKLAPRHEITLISFGTPEELASAPELCSLCRQIEIVPYPKRQIHQRLISTFGSSLPDMALRLESDAMRRVAWRMMQESAFDVIQVEGIEMARYVLDPEPQINTPIVFDDHNAEYMLQRSAFEADTRSPPRWHAAAYSLIQWFKLVRYERAICSRAQHVLAASTADADSIRRLGITTPITIVPNGVDTRHFVPSTEVCSKPLSDVAMVYAGKMDFRPNVDAMVWFCSEILPRVRAEIPLAHIVIVGQKPSQPVQRLVGHPGVEVTGWVADTRPFIADAAVYVVPLRMGSGTRLKVLEAMAMGKAIVSTSRGVEGIDLVHGRDVLVAASPMDFAAEIVSLMRDPGKRTELGNSARHRVETTYDWDIIMPKLDEVYSSLFPL